MTTSRQDKVLHLLERVGEPLFLLKGEGKYFYDIPQNILPEEYRPLAEDVSNRFGNQPDVTVVRLEPANVPDLTEIISAVPQGRIFSYFIPRHREAATQLVRLLMGIQNIDEFFTVAAACRFRVDNALFVYCFSSAVIRRSDLRSVVRLPPIYEILPDRFANNLVLRQAGQQAALAPAEQQAPIVIDTEFSGTDRDPEHRVAYWREDYGLNAHHWHWHLVYPMEENLRRDRRGELFYYMHQQLVARYDNERLSVGLPRIGRLNNWGEPIEMAYFPNLTSQNSGTNWGGRPAGLRLQDIDIPDVQFDINTMSRWRDRIFEAIHRGFVTNVQGQNIQLDEARGIDILGDMVESSILSVNRTFYGEMHNMGHVAISFIHDPDQRHRANMGVMGDSMTAVRDPVFFRWHKYCDDIFQEFKATLQPYTVEQLSFPNIRITRSEVITGGRPTNTLATFWEQRSIELTRGLDFGRRAPILVRIQHLQHEKFKYRIQIENSGSAAREVTIRIFLSARFDELRRPIPLRQQRSLMAEMDKFVVTLQPGANTVERNDVESNVTIPFERTFRQLQQTQPPLAGTPQTTPPFTGETVNQFNFCGCGWPEHLLIPRGNEQLFPCHLFVMVTNWEDDRVEQRNPDVAPCQNAASYCGLLDENYPDRRPMGFPFDRPPRASVSTIQGFLTPNMALTEVQINHSNQVSFKAGN